MNDQLIPLFVAIIGFLLGVILTWKILRTQIAAAAEGGKLEGRIELATTSQLLQSKNARLAEVEQDLETANQARIELTEQAAALREASSGASAALKAEQENLVTTRRELDEEKKKREQVQSEAAQLSTKLAQLNTELNAEKK